MGLRGVGKTVLLNEVQAMAEEEGVLTDFIEVANKEPLSITIIATLRSILLKLDRIKGVSEHVRKSLRVNEEALRARWQHAHAKTLELCVAKVVGTRSRPQRFDPGFGERETRHGRFAYGQ